MQAGIQATRIDVVHALGLGHKERRDKASSPQNRANVRVDGHAAGSSACLQQGPSSQRNGKDIRNSIKSSQASAKSPTYAACIRTDRHHSESDHYFDHIHSEMAQEGRAGGMNPHGFEYGGIYEVHGGIFDQHGGNHTDEEASLQGDSDLGVLCATPEPELQEEKDVHETPFDGTPGHLGIRVKREPEPGSDACLLYRRPEHARIHITPAPEPDSDFRGEI
jgi:hypothetical protein